MIIVSVMKEKARQYSRGTDLIWGASDCVMEEQALKSRRHVLIFLILMIV